MSKNTQVGVFALAIVLLLLALSGIGSAGLKAVGVEPDGVQLADAMIGLGGLVPLVMIWLSDRRRERIAAGHVNLVLEALLQTMERDELTGELTTHVEVERLVLPYHPRRDEVSTRAGLFGGLGAVAGARRFDLGHALLNVVSSGSYDDFVSGKSDTLIIACPPKELTEFRLDSEAFLKGELRKSPPQFAPKPAKELIEILELLKALQEEVKELKEAKNG